MFEKGKYSFLKPEVKSKPLSAGRFTVVETIENLPESVREKVPNGYVVKGYKPDELRGLFSDIYISDLDICAKRLKEREQFVRDYFAGTGPLQSWNAWELKNVPRLPKLVVPSNFLVAKNNETGEKQIFQIQEKIIHLLRPLGFVATPEREKELDALDFKAKVRAIGETLAFIGRAKKFPLQNVDYHNRILDLNPDNLLLTEEGRLRLIDTNRLRLRDSVFDHENENNEWNPPRFKNLEALVNSLKQRSREKQ